MGRSEARSTPSRFAAIAAARARSGFTAPRWARGAQLREHLVAGGSEGLPQLLVVGAPGAARRAPRLHLRRQRGLGGGRVEGLDERLSLLDQRSLGRARPTASAIALGGHRPAPIESRAAAGREALPERLLLIASGMPGGLPLRHQPFEGVPDRPPVVRCRQRLALGDQRLLALDRRGALARPLGVGAVALLVEPLARGGEAPPQFAIAHLTGRWGRLPAFEQIAVRLGGFGIARRSGQAFGFLGDRGAKHLGQGALILSREHDLLGHLARGRLLGRRVVLSRNLLERRLLGTRLLDRGGVACRGRVVACLVLGDDTGRLALRLLVGNGLFGDRLLDDRLLGNRLLDDRLLDDRLLGDRLLGSRLLGNRLLDDRLLGNGLLDDRLLGNGLLGSRLWGDRVV